MENSSEKSDNDTDPPEVEPSSSKEGEIKPSCNSSGVEGDKRKFRSLTFCRRYKSKGRDGQGKKRKTTGPWSFKLSCCRIRKRLDGAEIPEPTAACNTCVCTGYRRTEEHHLGAGVVFESTPPSTRRTFSERLDYPRFSRTSTGKSLLPAIDLNRFNPKDYPIEDCDERARLQRAREIEEGIDPPTSYQPSTSSLYRSNAQLAQLVSIFHNRFSLNLLHRPSLGSFSSEGAYAEADPQSRLPNLFEEPHLHRMVHTQVDYIHCLVPDLLAIANCQFYWGKMDRYEAEKLLENRPEGAFLLRDSAQEEYLFSVSFRRYGRLMHARIEQWNHRFSFDSHDPAVFSSETVCGLIEHYKDPNSCTSFEPMLTIPLHRTSTFSLQHLCRSVICSRTTYDSISRLHLPKPLKTYLKEYHYKQRVRVRRFDVEQ